MSKTIDKRAKFNFVRYANCWEDPLLLLGALPPGARCLSIASAGDNSFSLLTGDVEEVVAFDLNPTQLALCALKKAAFQTLDHPAFVKFLGFAPAEPGERRDVYRSRVRAALPPAVAAHYDARPALIDGGVVEGGKFEAYFRIFANRVLPLTHSSAERRSLMTAKPLAARREFFERTWANARYKLLFKAFFNKYVMGRLGRDPEFFRYVDKFAISGEIWKRAKYAMTELPTEDNPYLRYTIMGSFEGVLPHYARPEQFARIRSRLDRIRFVQGSPADLKREGEGFTFFNLSDIFEYMAGDLFTATARQLFALAAPHAVFAYYNMLLPRDLARTLPDLFTARTDLARRLFAANQAFFYGSYHVDETLT